MFGVKRFHNYLCGQVLTLQTHHKPLVSILGPKEGIPPLAAARPQRWALVLSGYTFDIQYRSTQAHSNADGLSRLPLPDKRPLGNQEDATAFMVGQLDALPVLATELASATRADPIIGVAIHEKGMA